MSRTSQRRTLTAGSLVALGCATALLPSPASALTAKVEGDQVVINAIGLERNTIQIDFLSSRVVEIRELNPSGPVLFGIGLACDRLGTPAERPRRMVCNADLIRRVVGDLGAGDDTLTVVGNPIPVDINGGLGSDRLTGGDGPDRLNAGGGPSVVRETLRGGPGADRLETGGGGVSIDADGGPGEDTLIGGDRADLLRGGDDRDSVFGGEAGDFLDGGNGNDLLTGAGGDDTIEAGPGFDDVNGDDGNDTFRLVDAVRDIFSCGFGSDVAEVDLFDFTGFKAQCETVRSAPVGLHPTVAILARSIRVGAGIRVDLACPAVLAPACAGTLKGVAVRGRRGQRLIGLGRVDYSVAGGTRQTIRVPLSPRARRVLAASPRLRLTSVEPGNDRGPKTVSITVATSE